LYYNHPEIDLILITSTINKLLTKKNHVAFAD
jgi:hypothetical protein